MLLTAVLTSLSPAIARAQERPTWLELQRYGSEQRLELNESQREMLERSKAESASPDWTTQRLIRKEQLDQRFLQDRQLRKQRLIDRRSWSDSPQPPAPRPTTQMQRSKTEQRQQQLQFKMERRAREALPSDGNSRSNGSLRLE